MENPIRLIPLANGLEICFFDRTRHYYGDFYLVKVEIVCEVPIQTNFFADEADLNEARTLLGSTAVYRRAVEQMGVPATEIERVRERLMANFEEHSLPYFAAASFPRKLVLAEVEKRRARRGRSSVSRHDDDA